MLICQLSHPNSQADSRSHVGCLQQIPNLGNVTIGVSVLKTTRSSLNHLLRRDLVSYVERGAVSAFNSRAQLSPCIAVTSLMLTAIARSLSITGYLCQCSGTARSLQTLMMKGRAKHHPPVISRAQHFDVFLEEVKRGVALPRGIYLLNTRILSWAWRGGMSETIRAV